jgi:hypothetical protein
MADLTIIETMADDVAADGGRPGSEDPDRMVQAAGSAI